MNIPTFPQFKDIELEDRKEIEKITKQFPPYSDYNFTSLWSYNIENDTKIAKLHDSLVVRFRDYISSEPSYSFFGDKNVLATIDTLLKHAKKEGIIPKLKLLPEFILQNNKHISNKFLVEEDRNHFDYIFSVKDIKSLEGSAYKTKRKMVNRFKREYPQSRIVLIDLKNQSMHKHILHIFSMWKQNKGKSRRETNHELIAIKRLLNYANVFNLICIGIYCKEELKGFLIAEIVHDKYSISHFVKADPSYTGIFEFIYQSTAQELYKRKCKYINREQDLGIPGLRQAKISWRPIKFLKKYIISPKDKD